MAKSSPTRDLHLQVHYHNDKKNSMSERPPAQAAEQRLASSCMRRKYQVGPALSLHARGGQRAAADRQRSPRPSRPAADVINVARLRPGQRWASVSRARAACAAGALCWVRTPRTVCQHVGHTPKHERCFSAVRLALPPAGLPWMDEGRQLCGRALP